MKNQNFKRVLSLVAGSLVVALVISIMPGSYLVNAEEVSKREARKLALEELEELKYIDDDTKVSSVVIDESNLDKEEPFYILYIRTDEFEYKVKVDAEDSKGNIFEIKEKDLETNKQIVVKDEKDDKNDDKNLAFEEYKEDIDYDDDEKEFELDKELYEGKKPTDEASLNQIIQDGKKAAIADFKETKNKEEFKEAKEILKEIKKSEKAKIKENKNNDDDDREEDKNIVDKELKTEKQVLLIALDKIGVKVTRDQVKELNNLKRIRQYEELFGLEDLEIELDNDDNPSTYEIEFKYGKYEYEIKINAVSGAILDYERDYDDDYDQDDDDDDEDDNKNKNKGNKKNKKSNKNKSKGNKKNNK